jgi:hypothetical protein
MEMEAELKPGVVFKFRRPAGVPKKPPSRAMTEALQRLSESDEMQDFLSEAKAQSRTVVVEVFHSREGRPLLIHTAVLPKKRA